MWTLAVQNSDELFLLVFHLNHYKNA